MGQRQIDVVAGLIVRNGKVLIARRPQGKMRAGQWEFPGGKAEAGESPEEALAREIAEELGCRAWPTETFETVEHDYPDARVTVRFIACRIEGEPERLEHSELLWVSPEALADYQFVEADREVLPRIAEAVRAGRL